MARLPSLRRLSTRVTALLLAAMVCAGSADLGHSGWDDPSCNPIPVHHDHNAHRFQSGGLPAAPDNDHCVLCHSLRSLRDGLIATPVAIVASARIEILDAASASLSSRIAASAAPSRAPPHSIL